MAILSDLPQKQMPFIAAVKTCKQTKPLLFGRFYYYCSK